MWASVAAADSFEPSKVERISEEGVVVGVVADCDWEPPGEKKIENLRMKNNLLVYLHIYVRVHVHSIRKMKSDTSHLHTLYH